MKLLGLYVVFVLIQTMVFNVATVLMCRWLGVGVKEFGVFYGPKLARWKVGECEVSLGLLPTGGFVAPDQAALRSRSLGARVMMTLSGWLATACLGLVLLGGAEFTHYALSVLRHLVPATLHPLTVGVECVSKLAVVATHSFWTGLGVFGAISFAMGLLPWPVMPVYRALCEICGREMVAAEERTGGTTVLEKVEMVAMMLYLVMLCAWALAAGVFFWRLVMWGGLGE